MRDNKVPSALKTRRIGHSDMPTIGTIRDVTESPYCVRHTSGQSIFPTHINYPNIPPVGAIPCCTMLP